MSVLDAVTLWNIANLIALAIVGIVFIRGLLRK